MKKGNILPFGAPSSLRLFDYGICYFLVED